MFDLMRDPARLGPMIMKGLEAMIRSIPERGSMVEVGCYAGESTLAFAKEFGVVHAVDPWSDLTMFGISDPAEVERAFDERMERHPNVRKMRMTSAEAAPRFEDDTLDLVYIDADHDYYSALRDIELWYPKVRLGGYIGGHDYLPDNVQWSRVAQAVAAVFGEEIPHVFADSSWLIRKEVGPKRL